MTTTFIETHTPIANALGELFRRSQRAFYRPVKTLRELFPDIVASKGDMTQIPMELTCDSRKVEHGSLFFVPESAKVDGMGFVPEAIARGALAVVSHRPLPSRLPVTTIQVPSLPHAISDAARRFFGMADRKLSLIGVAGSRGKTTFSHLLRHLLANAGNDCGMLSTIENDFGGRIMPSHQTTAEAIDLAGYFARMVEYGCKSAIVEISPTAIMQGRTLGLDFEAAIFTNLIAQCGQEEAVYGLWKKFFDGSLGSRPKTAIINLDDPYGQRLHGEIHEHVETITYGTLPACDIRVEEMAGNKSGVAFKFRLGNRRYNATLPMIGEMNVMNALGTMAVAYSLGENVKDSAACLADFAGVPGRLERINMGQPFEVVVDYAHTEESLKNTLAELRKITAGRIATVFGCGGGHSADKRGSITRAVMTGSDLTIATADNPRLEKISEIFKMMQAGIVEGKSIEFVEDRREAIGKAINAARTGDCVLIAGKGHEATQEMGGRIVPFDDRTVAKEMLRGILTKQS